MKIILDWCSPQVARSMLDDLDFYVAEITDNESLEQSIKMVREMLYARAEENLEIDAEEEEYTKGMLRDEMNRQRGMTKE
jgi:predicted Zn-dependent peptidase